MTEVSKASAYPKSVQPGLPRLGTTPPGWSRGPLSEHLFEEARPVNMADDELYDLVTVKRSRGGVVLRERLKGKEIAVKSQFRVKAGDFLISKRQIVHGACGIVPPELDGAIVSNEYAVLRARPSLDLHFLNYLAHSIYFQQTCFHSSIGVHVEKMIFKLGEWLKWDFDLPPILEQKRIVEILSTWDGAISKAAERVAVTENFSHALTTLIMSGEVRLPSHSDPWKHRLLGDVCDFKGGAGFSEAAQGSSVGELPFIKVSDMSLPGNEVDIVTANNWVTREVAKSLRATPMPSGAVVFAKVGAALMLNRRRRLKFDTIIDNNMMAAIPKADDISTDFLFLLMCTIDLAALVQPGAVPSVNQRQLSSIPIKLPGKSEQAAIADVLLNMRSLLQGLKLYEHHLRREKLAVSGLLISGRRRAFASAEAA